jgi:hypothetical protein
VQRWELIASYTSSALYRLLGRKKQPIEIQRQMGIRSLRLRLPRVIATLSAAAMDLGSRSEASMYGCLLVEARKLENNQS